MPKSQLENKIFGRLLVLQEAGRRGPNVLWKCKCKCGNITYLTSNTLSTGNTRSCGCLHRQQLSERSKTHGASIGRKEQPLYKIWLNMHTRVYNKNNKNYKDYGGRGIKICQEWHKYEPFRDYMLSLKNCPSQSQIPGSKLEREIDRYPNNDGNYEPGNVRWASRKEQLRNKRSNKYIKINGVRMVFADAVEKYGKVSRKLIETRLRRGWNFKEAFLTPGSHTRD